MRGWVPMTGALYPSSNDSLSIAKHSKIVWAIANSVRRNGNSALMSRIFFHGAWQRLQLEDRLATFMHAESGVPCQSGWCANTGLVQASANEHTPTHVAMLAHNSLWEDIQSAGAKAITTFHNEPEHLERQILRHGRGVVPVDSVYSTNGSICPLPEVTGICNAQGCVPPVLHTSSSSRTKSNSRRCMKLPTISRHPLSC